MSADTSASATVLLAELSNTLRQAAIDVVWVQWRALGAQTSARSHARSIVDPEALVLMTLALSGAESRLRDVLADWVIVNASLLSVQRFKNLLADHQEDVQASAGRFAQFALIEAKDVRWRSLAIKGAELTRRTNKLRAREISFEEAASLWLRLRLAFSVGIKADTMTFLLGSEGAWASGRAIANATGYTLPAVRRAVDDLSRAGLVITKKRSGPAEYSVRAQPWSAALGLEGPVPVWRNWHERFVFVAAFLTWAEQAQRRSVSRYAFGTIGRDLLANHASALDVEVEGTGASRARREVSDAAAIVEQSVRRFAQRLVRDV
jgi:hypothetical protein